MTSGIDYFKLHFIVFLWGFSAILGKLVSIPAVEMVFYRVILAAIGMGAVIFLTKGQFRVSSADLIRLFLVGIIVALHWILFFASARVSNVSVSLVGFATNSLWAALMEPWFTKSRIKPFEIVLGLVVLVGLYIIFSFNFEYRAGLALGVLAGFTSSLFAIFNSLLVKRIPARTISFYEMIGAFIGVSLFLPVYQMTFAPGNTLHLAPTFMDLVYIVLLAGVCSVYAYTVGVELMKRIPVFMMQLTLNLEPVYGIIMAVIIFGQQEEMTMNFYIGTFVIFSAVLAYPFLKKRFTKVKTPDVITNHK